MRSLLRYLGRVLLPAFARLEISGLRRFPAQGPLLVVGNHTGALEVVLMTVFSPRVVEFMGSVDIPHEPYIAAVIGTYGFIPFRRGEVSRAALQSALEVLEQGGVLGLFPEGGIWEQGIGRAQSGVAWLSHRAGAPILPVGFSSTRGALGAMLRLHRPELTMRIGFPMPPVELVKGKPRKAQLNGAAEQIMEEIWQLVPEEDRLRRKAKEEEEFEFLAEVVDGEGQPVLIPEGLAIQHGTALSKFLHRPMLFNNLLVNVGLPIAVLRCLGDYPEPEGIMKATRAILHYLEGHNPHYFTYRYGIEQGRAMETGLRELEALCNWAAMEGYQLRARAVRRYRSPGEKSWKVTSEPQLEVDKW